MVIFFRLIPLFSDSKSIESNMHTKTHYDYAYENKEKVTATFTLKPIDLLLKS